MRPQALYQLGVSNGQQSVLYRRHQAIVVVLCGDHTQVLSGVRHKICRACTASQSVTSRHVAGALILEA